MENHQICQTTLDQMVSSERAQMLKACIPYLPHKAQQILSFYTKSNELINTFRMFSSPNTLQICSMEESSASPIQMINDIRKYCYGQSQQQIDEITNLFVIIEMLSIMNTP